MYCENYLYLATSKLREGGIGPKLVINDNFQSLERKVNIRLNNQEIWSKDIKTSKNNMAHSLENLEYHHFKYANPYLPLQAHVHFFGADALSFGAGTNVQNGNEMLVH